MSSNLIARSNTGPPCSGAGAALFRGVPAMDELLLSLLRTPGISGCEERVRALVESALPGGVAQESDAMGNLVATIGEGEEAILFCAHLDEIGFVVTEVREDGFLRLRAVGGIDPRTVLGHVVRVVTEGGERLGVLGVNPPHLMRDRAKEMKEVPRGDGALPRRGGDESRRGGGPRLSRARLRRPRKTALRRERPLPRGRALDDRLGCWVLLRALERLQGEHFRKRLHFAFTVQEEVGLRGAEVLSRRMSLTHVFAVDSASAADYPHGLPRPESRGPGQGACLRVLDNASIIPPAFTREIEALAAREGIPLQIIFGGGGTDVGAFQYGGARVMPLGIPLRYTHAAVEMAHRADVDATLDFVCALARKYGG
ncbi:MAG: hypothetical protein HC813_01885 [Planctomycetes bacterium]|nr:hypothetical protein [Planctomycetota bacterium]